MLLPLLTIVFPILIPGLPDPELAAVQPFQPKPRNQNPTLPSTTIPAFPEQSNLASCQLDLLPDLFRAIKASCGGPTGQLHKSRCCPVLAAWLYSAYSTTALSALVPYTNRSSGRPTTTTPYDMPLLPDDSETCVDDLEKGMREKAGMELVRPNETCDLVSCYCGIRLHPLSCRGFGLSVDKRGGELVGDESVKKLERDCLSRGNQFSTATTLGSCSKCLKSLHLLNNKMTLNSSKSDDRTAKIRNKDCQLMGLTWLLAKNRTAYIHMVSAVLRAMMMSTDGSNPQSCTLTRDSMPLAADSSEIYNQSFSVNCEVPFCVSVALICLLYLRFIV